MATKACAVVTNVDLDHMDTYGGDPQRLYGAFVEFLQRLPFYGLAVLCHDDPMLMALRERIGRAWGGDSAGAEKPEWLSNVGVGLRIVNTRWAFRNVIHIDIAAPLNAPSDVDRVQLLIRSKQTF